MGHVALVEERLSRARAAISTGDRARASSETDAGLDEAREIGWSPFVARALHLRGRALLLAGDYDRAAQSFRDAYLMAAEAGATELAAQAAIQATTTTGVKQQRRDAGMLWTRLAEDLVFQPWP